MTTDKLLQLENKGETWIGDVVEGRLDLRDQADLMSIAVPGTREMQFPWQVVVPRDMYGSPNVRDNRFYVILNRHEIFGGGRVVLKGRSRLGLPVEAAISDALQGRPAKAGGSADHFLARSSGAKSARAVTT